MSKIIDEIYESIIEGDVAAVETSVTAALAETISPNEVLNQGMIAAMTEVGQLFEEGDYFVPEMLIAARAMKAGLDLLKPSLVASGVEPVGKVVLGTVQGDLHDIGKNLVSMMLEGAGFEVIDLGTDVPPSRFVEAIGAGADIVGLSALLTTTMPAMASTIQAIDRAGLRHQVKIMVGGAPVTAEYANSIGADGYSEDAGRAASVAKVLMG